MNKVNPITGRETRTGRVRGTTRPLDEAARQLRRTKTPSEQLLWSHLRGHRLAGLSFRRQHPIGGFVVDFACPARLLIVEVDGSVHDVSVEQDRERDAILSKYGWQVLRFSNDDVQSNIGDVLDKILLSANARSAVYGRETNKHTS